ncbi:MAG: flagellar type III secretion system pore protein FliP [Spirochaetia bacterium]|nr:flagellar type III secretion system pore protein FliP [Spirochaetia bacterium]
MKKLIKIINKHKRIIFICLFFTIFTLPLISQEIPIPKIDFNITEAQGPKEVALSLQILLLITLLSMAPAIILMLTSFTKIIIIFDFIKRALSLQNMPPNQIMVSLALFMTFFIMAPTFNEINEKALEPYLEGKIQATNFFENASLPIRDFMSRQIGTEGVKEVALFIKLSKSPPPKTEKDIPFFVLVPAFMLTELKKAFIVGIYLFIPFLIIDMVVASTLMSMGMIMLPPVMISLPFKIILFVLVDGWSMLTYQIVRSYTG